MQCGILNVESTEESTKKDEEVGVPGKESERRLGMSQFS